MLFGIFLLCIGALYLLRNFGLFHGSIWNWAWPILLICMGIWLIIKPFAYRANSDESNEQSKDLTTNIPPSD
ncbi:MAG: hypothetical protein J7K40_11260 [candidate division Zixibacteria bacterium]|nr:hypothetical protein [candidate division Zixibacteria bacterium]